MLEEKFSKVLGLSLLVEGLINENTFSLEVEFGVKSPHEVAGMEDTTNLTKEKTVWMFVESPQNMGIRLFL